MKYSNKKPDIIKIDTGSYYIVPMMPKTNSDTDYTEYPVKTKIFQDSYGDVHVQHEGYKDKYFADRSFEFLRDIGYIKRCK